VSTDSPPEHFLLDSTLSIHLADESATQALGARLAAIVQPGLIVYLRGELGAGKTTLVRALLHALGYSGKVKSPTYTLVELYNLSNLCLYHFDFYRFSEPDEWIDAGFRDYFGVQAACFVEWPDQAGGLLPPPDLEITLVFEGTGRQMEIRASSDKGLQCLNLLTTS
jgi:tRNA threonylcarbamoyladenosine biosynthesis protein TsaE